MRLFSQKLFFLLLFGLTAFTSKKNFGMEEPVFKKIKTAPDQEQLDSALLIAVKELNLNAIEKLIQEGANVNTHVHGYYPLHFAAIKDSGTEDEQSVRATIVQTLLDAGADVTVENQFGSTPLHNAALSNNVPVIKLLIKAGAHINASTEEGETPLSLAARNGDPIAVWLLLKAGANVNERNSQNFTPLDHVKDSGNEPFEHLAFSYKSSFSPEIFRLLMRYGARPDFCNSKQKELFYRAFSEIILKTGKEKLTDLQEIITADINTIEALASLVFLRDVIKDPNGVSALVYVAAQGQLDKLKLLLTQKAYQRDYDSLDHALYQVASILANNSLTQEEKLNYRDILNLLIDEQAQLMTSGRNFVILLRQAHEEQNYELVSRLINAATSMQLQRARDFASSNNFISLTYSLEEELAKRLLSIAQQPEAAGAEPTVSRLSLLPSDILTYLIPFVLHPSFPSKS
jgi:ankyrin repeat protein